MTSREENSDRAQILQVMGSYHAAMIEARTADLDKLLADDYSLVHITGHVQPKNEWFGVIRSGEFDYHRIDVEEKAISVSITGSTAVVIGRGIFNATINGMKNPWRLQFTLQFEKHDGTWTIMRARYSTF